MPKQSETCNVMNIDQACHFTLDSIAHPTLQSNIALGSLGGTPRFAELPTLRITPIPGSTKTNTKTALFVRVLELLHSQPPEPPQPRTAAERNNQPRTAQTARRAGSRGASGVSFPLGFTSLASGDPVITTEQAVQRS